MEFFRNLKRNRYFSSNARRFVHHILQRPCDVVSAVRDQVWESSREEGVFFEDRQHFDNVLYMACIVARASWELRRVEQAFGRRPAGILANWIADSAQSVFGNQEVFQELLTMAMAELAALDGAAGPAAGSPEVYLHAVVRRMTRDNTCFDARHFAAMNAVFTEGGLVADLARGEIGDLAVDAGR